MDVEIYLPNYRRESPDGSCFSSRAPPGTAASRGKSFALPAQTSDLFNSAKIASACPPLFPVVVVVSLAIRMMWH
jgi:hypothetical protein